MGIQLDIVSVSGQIATLFAVDIGNSAIKLYSNYNKFFYSYKSNWEKEIKLLLGSLSNQIVLFVVSSVNSEKYNYFSSLIDLNIFHKIIKVDEMFLTQKIISFKKVQNIGNDRKLGLIAATTYSDPPFITVDLGTATTINFVNADYECLGGAILPGIFTQLRSLVENTAALKRIKLESPTEILGMDTNSAVSSGIINGMLGTILFFINNLRCQFKDNTIKVFVTGGNARWVYDALMLKSNEIYEKPNLVLEGIVKLAKNYFQ